MPITANDFEKELKEAGYSVERTKKGHFNVYDQAGCKVANHAVGHGRNKGLVLDCYVSRI